MAENTTGYCCMVLATKGDEQGVGFHTFAEAIAWVFARRTKAWEILLTSGFYELSIEELSCAFNVPKLQIGGGGKTGKTQTVIRLFGFKRDEVDKVTKIVTELSLTGVRVLI